MAKRQAKILLVNNESTYMDGLRKVVKKHANGKAEIVEALIKDEKDTKKKLNPENVGQYDAVVLSGSFKRRYDAPEVQYIIKTVDDHNNKKENKANQIGLYGACLGHQAMIHYHGKGGGGGEKAEFIDLGKYVKGDKEVTLADGSKVKSHKHHKHAFKTAPNLETIANSTVKNAKGKDVNIIEATKHPTKPYLTSQGHAAREGHARDLLYQILDYAYKKAA